VFECDNIIYFVLFIRFNPIISVRLVGMAVDRVWSGYPRILGMWVVGLVHIFAHGFADLIAATLWVWGRFYISPADIHWSSKKLIPINPHK
jgi:hypothetical protein